jgi:hypothetical protein
MAQYCRRRMSSSGMFRRMALVRTDDSEEHSASIIRVIRIGELRTLVVTSNRRRLRRNTAYGICHPDDGGATRSSETSVLNKSHTA